MRYRILIKTNIYCYLCLSAQGPYVIVVLLVKTMSSPHSGSDSELKSLADGTKPEIVMLVGYLQAFLLSLIK